MLARALPAHRILCTTLVLRRHNCGMMAAQSTPPSEPLIVVLGTTGTGKSDLAVDLACRFNGEIINADAMQMYKGLPIITNKISAEEQRGIPHHLLGNIGLDEPTWTVHEFRREAGRIIREIRSRGRLPIVVGGTHYYADGLLFDDRLVTKADEARAIGDQQQQQQQQQDDPQLSREELLLQDAPTETLLARLREVDPVIAERWHPNDRRKIWRSLQIYLTTGRRASDIYGEQQQRRRDGAKQADDGQEIASAAPWDTLLLWVYSKRDVLNARLDRRVDVMLERGLVEETRELHGYLQQAGDGINRTSGIWQSIGFAQMEPYLDALHQQQQQQPPGSNEEDTIPGISPAKLEALKSMGVEAVKGATRRYAKHQNRWITYKTLPLLQEEGALGHLFLLDSTGGAGDAWTAEVAEKAAGVAARYLRGDKLPAPESLSETAAEVLRSSIETASGRQVMWSAKTCDVCRTTLVTEELWQTHIKGNRHKRALKAAQRRALAVRYSRVTALAVVEDDVTQSTPPDSNTA